MSADGRRWATLLADRRYIALLLLGFASGLPLALTTSTLAWWMRQAGVDLTTIGLFALVGLPYSVKFLWAPFFDFSAPPLLSRWLGARRAWIIACQALLALAIVVLGGADPALAPTSTALAALAVSSASASQDIAIDAWRIEALKVEEQGMGAFSYQTGYRLGLLLAGAGALLLSAHYDWPLVYAVMAALLAPGVAATLLAPRTPRERAAPAGATPGVAPPSGVAPLAAPRRVTARRAALLAPFMDFANRPAWLLALAFIPLYKLGDAVAGVMAYPFYYDLGFSADQLALVSKAFGTGATITGTLLGALACLKWGLYRTLLVAGALQLLSNFAYAALALVGDAVGMLFVTVGFENLSAGMGAAAFVAVLSAWCRPAFAATQYALLSSFAVFGRTLLSSGGGWLAERLNWPLFFIVSAAAALPGLLLLVALRRRSAGAFSAPPAPSAPS